jgi:hypothetical protein
VEGSFDDYGGSASGTRQMATTLGSKDGVVGNADCGIGNDKMAMRWESERCAVLRGVRNGIVARNWSTYAGQGGGWSGSGSTLDHALSLLWYEGAHIAGAIFGGMSSMVMREREGERRD